MKRMARLLPIYYIALLFSLYWPLLMFQDPKDNYWVRTAPSVLPRLSSLIVIAILTADMNRNPQDPKLRFYLSWFNLTSLVGLTPFNGPLWTISVLIFMYAAFPFLLHRLQGVQNRLTWCLHNYWISIVAYICFFFAGSALGPAIGCGAVDYFLARGFPLGRLPVFIMGCLLGELPSPPPMRDDGSLHASKECR